MTKFSERDDEYEEDILNEHVEDPGDPDGVIAAEKRQQWEDRHARAPIKHMRDHKSKRWFWFPACLVVVVAIVGAYWLGNHHAEDNVVARTTEAHSTALSAKTSQPTIAPIKHYDSTNYSLGFDYPNNWKVSDTTTKLTVTSPSYSLETAVGATSSVHVLITIQNQQAMVSGFPAAGAVASLVSNDMTYTQPSASQRAQTYMSYLSYTVSNGLDAIFLTGNTGYQQGQQVPMSDIVAGDPLIGVGFEKCTTPDCQGGTTDDVTLRATSWNSSSVSTEVTNVLKSIVITTS